jgi:predicted dehydrogenase
LPRAQAVFNPVVFDVHLKRFVHSFPARRNDKFSCFQSETGHQKYEEKMSDHKTIRVAVLGGGYRGCGVTQRLLRDSEGHVQIVSLFDPNPEVARKAVETWGQHTKICSSYQEAIDCEGVDWVMVFSPNVYHKEQIIYAFDQGKHVFAEKPLAASVEGCQEVFDAHQKTDRLFATGFVLRYAPLYRRVKEILDSGILGKIISIDANENITPAHGGYIMCNWRRHTRLAGPHILEKCCHDIDLLNWFCGSIPSRVASFGGLDFFVPENEPLRQKYGAGVFKNLPDPEAVDSPFLSEKDLKDNQISILEYRNNIRVMFQATMSNPIPERRMYFSCTEGTMIAELYSGTLRYKTLGDTEETSVTISGDGHGGGDDYIMKELYETMRLGTEPKCSGNEGLESSVTALMLDESAKQGAVINMEPIWEKLVR